LGKSVHINRSGNYSGLGLPPKPFLSLLNLFGYSFEFLKLFEMNTVSSCNLFITIIEKVESLLKQVRKYVYFHKDSDTLTKQKN